ncbi:hypothetical protein D3C86_1018480 [compost metagenome]
MQEGRELSLISYHSLRVAGFGRVGAVAFAHEADPALVADEGGEALVEARFSLQEHRPVRQLVDDGVGEHRRLVLQEGRVERIGDPPQQAEGGDAAQVGVEALGLEALLLGDRLGAIEEALVGHGPHHGEVPQVGFELVLGGARDHVGDRIAIEHDHMVVARALLEAEGAGGVGLGARHHVEPLPLFVAQPCVGAGGLHGFALEEKGCLPVTLLEQVPRAASVEHQHSPRDGGSESRLCAGLHPLPPLSWTLHFKPKCAGTICLGCPLGILLLGYWHAPPGAWCREAR